MKYALHPTAYTANLCGYQLMMNTIKEAAYPKPMARLSVTSSIKCKTLTTQSKSGRNLQSRIKNKPKEPTTAITVKFISLGRSSIFLVLKYTPTTKSMQALAQSTKIIVIEFFGRIRHQSFIRLMCTRYYKGTIHLAVNSDNATWQYPYFPYINPSTINGRSYHNH